MGGKKKSKIPLGLIMNYSYPDPYLFDDRTVYYTSSTKQPLTTVRRSLCLEKN